MKQQPVSRQHVSPGLALREIYGHLSSKSRARFLLLIAVMVLGAVAELAAIGSVIPFVALLAQAGTTVRLPWPVGELQSLLPWVGPSAVIVMGALFAGFAVLAGIVRLGLAWVTQDFAYRVGHELAVETQWRILSQPYSFHIDRHSSTLVTATDKVEILVLEMILPLLQTGIAAFIGSFVFAALFYISPLPTVAAAAAFVIIYALVSAIAGKRLAHNSEVVGTAYHGRMKIEQESLGGIRDVIIDDSQSVHVALFEKVNARLAGARATTKFITQAPRFVVESAGVVVFVALALLLARRPGGIVSALPFLGAIAIGAQRLLPLVQTVYAGWSLSAGGRSIAGQVLELLRLPVPKAEEGDRPLQLNERIRFDHVSFAYSSRRQIAVVEVTFDIPRGSMIALAGPTGSGKTTLADLLMALIPPTAGRVLVDDVPLTPDKAQLWHRAIAHVPQSIYLADSSIARNIALSLPKGPPDEERIIAAAKKAELHDFVLSLPDGYDTLVGERGVRLSGGQKQRLGIARAIYKDAPVLVLDEATSALDDATEGAVMKALVGLRAEGRTIIIVAHRLSTIRHCDLIARLDKGRLVEVGSVDQIRGAGGSLS